MEKLDQFFNDKMGQREIPFSEEHWKLAEQLLDEKKKKRRFAFLLWWGTGTFTAVGLACAIWFWPTNSKVQIDQFLIPFNGGTKSSIQKQTIVEKEDIQTKEISSQLDQDNTNNQSNTNFKTINKDKSESYTAVKNITSSIKNDTKQSIITENEEVNKESSEKTISNQLSVKENDQSISPKDDIDIKQKTQEYLLLSEFALLKTQLEYLNYPLRDIKHKILSQEATADEPKIKVAIKHWSWGLMANAMLYPYRTDANETLIGWNAGAFVGYKWNSSWGIQTGINYRLRTGQFGFAKDSNIASYRFGREDQRFLLLPNQLHYVEMPFIVQYSNQKHQFGLGARLQYLVGVRGSLRNTFDADSDPNLFNTNEVNQGWIVKDGFKEWPIDLTLSYFYEITSRWQVGLETSYTIGGILDETYERPFPVIYKESLPISLNVGLRFIID